MPTVFPEVQVIPRHHVSRIWLINVIDRWWYGMLVSFFFPGDGPSASHWDWDWVRFINIIDRWYSIHLASKWELVVVGWWLELVNFVFLLVRPDSSHWDRPASGRVRDADRKQKQCSDDSQGVFHHAFFWKCKNKSDMLFVSHGMLPPPHFVAQDPCLTHIILSKNQGKPRRRQDPNASPHFWASQPPPPSHLHKTKKNPTA